MIDHISVENLRALVIQEATPDKAEATRKYLDVITKQAQKKGLPSKYIISVEGSKVMIRQDSGIQGVPITLLQLKALSETRFMSLCEEIHKLEKEEEQEKLAQKIVGTTNIYAKKKLGLPVPTSKNQPVPKEKISPKLEALLAEQKRLGKH